MAEDIKHLQQAFIAFAKERDWEQFHTPKNIAMALNVEAGELMEHFQWLTAEQSKDLTNEKKTEVAHEIADVSLYLFRLSQLLDIDIIQACEEKMEINKQKYPADKVRGSAKKYKEYD